jgi:hypothetical protein
MRRQKTKTIKRDGAVKRRRHRSKASSEMTNLYSTIGADYAKGLIHPDKHSLDCLLRLRHHLQLFFRSERQQEAAQFLFLVWCQSFGFDNDLSEGRKQFDQAIKSLTGKRRGRPPSERGEQGQKARKIKEEDKDRTYRQILRQMWTEKGEDFDALDPKDQKSEIKKLKTMVHHQRRRAKEPRKGQRG